MVAGDPRVAVVGVACRLPRAPDPEAFWRLLAGAQHAIGEVPDDRLAGWADIDVDVDPGIQFGAFLDRVDCFDPAFFQISPREAAAMDPQQRLVLELAWEALEDTRIAPASIRGDRAGVFLGSIASDYSNLTHRSGPDAIGHHTMTGLHRSIIANRVSYTLGLTGPSLTVDAAQSSSLVAVHLACESLRKGEATFALAGGVHLNLDPSVALGAAKFGGLSPDGRCFTFDARANGYVRGEGGGVVALKPLAAAEADGDRIYCVIRGGAINNDGAGEGLTVPSRKAQESVIKEAFRQAGVEPSAAQYVELHGTGTAVGDPIEAAALGDALGADRPADDPLLVGSAKTNVGHLEGAAGVVGLIKATLAIEQRQIPASLNFKEPNPGIPFDALGLRVQTVEGDWPRKGRPLIAGVSSFGMGGTNCHLVLEEPPASRPTELEPTARAGEGDPAVKPLPSPIPLTLSAKAEPALAQAAERLVAHLEDHPELDPTDVAYSLANTRTAFEHRAVALGADRDELLGALGALALGQGHSGLTRAKAGREQRPVFLFPGQGAQVGGMALDLLESAPAFATHMAACEQALSPYVEWSLSEVLREEDARWLHRLDIVQPALFAVMVSLARLWRECGVEPTAVVGHSQGEIAAAHVAGALSLEDAALVIARRGQAMARIAGEGGMLSVSLTPEELTPRTEPYGERISLAAINGPASLVLSGDPKALAEIQAGLEQDEIRAQPIAVDYAAHSVQIENLKEELLDAFSSISPQNAELPIHSTVTGEAIEGAELGAEYWYRNLRQTVLLEPVLRGLLDAGKRAFIEIGPHPVLAFGVQETIEDVLADPGEASLFATLRREEAGAKRFALSLGEAHSQGVQVDWRAFFKGSGAKPGSLPTYPFQRRRYWLDLAEGEALPPAAPSGPVAGDQVAPRESDIFADRLLAAPEAERGPLALDLVRGEVAKVLGQDSADAVEPNRAFKELGFDSILALELRNRLQAITGLRLPATTVFKHPTASRLAKHILAEAVGGGDRERVAVRAQADDEPIAIVGMACRYPGGAGSPRELWGLVAEGRDGISPFPTDRGWDLERLYDPDPDRPDTAYSREGGFLAAAGAFDAEFFGIAPREALAMDPQQRLLLESCWEALESVGLDPASLGASPTAVYVGISSQDYSGGIRGPEGGLEGFRLTGSSTSVASGRVAYALGLEGPAVTIDTACSSSLVAMHLAAQVLRSGECTLALAGGATVLASPGMFTEFARQRGLAPDGRCKSFAEAADGTGWAEGVGIVALERLSDAERNGHPVLALLRGSAVNQDGASNGLTAPSGSSQERVIRQALANAGLAPADIDAVEAHGTGTNLGDPIEVEALLATYGQDRERPLKLGSIKSNIGHTQAAAGVAGVIKMTMAMREGVLPKTLHVDQPSSNVDWEAGKVELLTEPREWQPDGKPRRAGVSSFGISGTNAHVIIEEAPEPAAVGDTEESQAPRAPLPGAIALPLSAKTEPALREAASNLATHLQDNPDLDPTDIAFSLARTRALFDQRAAITGSDREQLLAGLAALSDGEPATNVFEAKAAPGKLAYLLTGQGAQRAGMGKELHEASPVFAEALEEACEALDPHLEQPLKELLFAEGGTPEAALLDQTTFTQPALFATETALYRLTESLGMAPDYLLGHSIGEISAAHISGVLSLQGAAKLVCARAKLMGALPEGGAMVAIEATEQEVQEALEGKEDQLSIAAINGPTATVISGEEQVATEVQSHFEAQGKRTKRLTVSHAFHSPLIEPMLEAFGEVAESLTYHEPKIPIVSNLSGEILTAEQAQDPSYWVSHARAAVRFAEGIETLDAQGVSTYLELGPDAVLTAMAASCLPEGSEAALIPTLREGRDEQGAIAAAIASAHVAGAKLDWAKLYPGAKRVPLPTYPFQRERFWLTGGAGANDLGAAGQKDADHPLLVAAIEDPEGERLTLTGRLSLSTHPWLADHAVLDTVILPGTAFLELALKAGEEVGCETVEELTLQAPLVLEEQGTAQLQVTVGSPNEQGARPVSIHSRTEAEGEPGEWVLHASGSLSAEAPTAPEPLTAWPPEGAEPLPTEDLYERLAEIGFDYGPAFQGLTAAWRAGEEIYAEVSLPEELRAESQRFGLHPALFDAALHGIALSEGEGFGELRLPFSWSGVSLREGGAEALRVKIVATGEGEVSLALADRAGTPLATVGSLISRRVDPTQLQSVGQGPQAGLLDLQWVQAPLPERSEAPTDVEQRRCEVDESLPSAEAARKATEETLEAIQQWLADESKTDTRLALITEGAMATSGEESPDPPAATIWGLIRSAQSEHPGRFALIDTDGTEASEAALPAALAKGAEEPQLALREGVALAPRAMSAKDTEDSLIPPRGPWHLDALQRGTLESLALTPAPGATEPLGPTEVRIQMQAAGLNFRDVLIALGLYPGEAPIGSEGAGVVLEVGEGVSDLSPGDRVMGMIGEAFGPLATTERELLIGVPEEWSFEQAAAMPVVFSTAFYGLIDLVGLKEGERVLIHAGAGGVGTAAIGIAKHRGAEVFATASPAKWDVLREAGLDDDHIASSRDLGFKEKFLATTGGEGVDVVLNALAGEFIDASLALLPRGGRFLEMGKTDLRDPGEIAAEHKGVAYLPFDVAEAGPKRTGQILAEIVSLFEQGALRHSQTTTWDMRKAPGAFRELREGMNVGKLVLTLPRAIDPDRTTLITGATGGLGALTARHLAEHHGARRLLLLSRSGEGAEGAKELRQELQELGASVEIAACDVADRKALEKLLAKVPKEHPLGAVIHCAGALADATVETMTSEQVEEALAPKAHGAQNLHELSKDADLSTFALFSSVAGTLGGPGQANYAAANVFCDALAQKRRAEGLPATSIAWGLWQREGGMVAGLSEADLARMRRGGIQPIADEQGLALFDAAIATDRPQVLAIPIETGALRAQASAGTLAPILSALVRTPRRRGPSGSLATKLASLPEAEREAHVLELVRGEVAAVLGHGSAAEIEPARAFKDLGFDSLATVELRNRLNSAAGLGLGATTVFDYPNSAALAARLLSEASAGGTSKAVAARAKASEEPIAIVGMACRYPGGVSSPQELWELVCEGREGITEFPTERGWDLARLYDPDPDNPGTSYTREGGFLTAAGEFDAEFFGIAPREALAMDPQQRLLLESSWEALEDAGIDPTSLRGEPAGVFAGLIHQGYGANAGAAAKELEGYRATGETASVASGRISYTLGLEGPAITIDTACSSSLVALHLAAGALRGAECTLALAGGVTAYANPGVFTEFSRQRGLAPDGRSKSFAEAADGVAWSEGVGMLVLERLSDAQRNGHRVLATIKGSAVNQDGASNGLTAPNGPSQERVIRQALANARLTPKDIDAVEAHGTGTTLGDPIEATALLATYGQDREAPLRLGSIKSNIGHTQAAAGVAGVIKMTEALRRGVLPKTLHVDAPSSKVDWEAGEIELLTEQAPWEADGRPRRAGISSFGISGTNAHVILEEAPEAEPVADEAESKPLAGPVPLVLSAKTEPALTDAFERLEAHLEANPDLDPIDVAYSLATTRTQMEHRAVAFGDPPVVAATGRARDGKLAYLCTGQGSQRLGMGRELYEADPLFEEAFDAVCAELDPHLGKSLQEIVFAKGKKAQALLEDTTHAQPALFAIEVSLHEALAKRGLKADLLTGHSVGEIAAAHIAGVLDLADAAKLIAARGALMGALPEGGAMAAIEATEQEVADSIEGRDKDIAIAAINGPTSTVISGKEDAVEEIQSHWEEQGRKTKRLAVSHAFHSPLIDPMLDEFAEVASSLTYSEPKLPVISNVTGEPLTPEQATDPAYWVSHAREPVRFADAISTMAAQGVTAYLELGPDPVLCAMARECLGEDPNQEQDRAAFVPTLREGRDEQVAIAAAIATAHVAGAKLDWAKLYPGAKRVGLPTYPFQRKRYWLAAGAGGGGAGAVGQGDPDHPMLAATIEDPQGDGVTLTGLISAQAQPWLADHVIFETIILPGTAFAELALRAGVEVGAQTVEELTLQAPLTLPEGGAAQLQVRVSAADEDGRREIRVHSRPDGEEGGEWNQHAAGTLLHEAAEHEPLEAWPPAGAEPREVEHVYEEIVERGLELGPAFHCMTAAWQRGNEFYAEVSLGPEQRQEATRFGIHPVLLDAALHTAMLNASSLEEHRRLGARLPFSWRGVCLGRAGADRLRVKTVFNDEWDVSLSLADAEGAPLATVGSLAMRPVAAEQFQLAGSGADGLLDLEWEEVSLPDGAGDAGEDAVLREAPVDRELPLDEAVLAATSAVLELVQEWLGAAEETRRLAILTRDAMASAADESPDPASAALWGLLRSAQSEHPGRFALIDSDGSEASGQALAAALAAGAEEPQLVLREGRALAPRLVRVEAGAPEAAQSRPIDPERTILVTGGTGGLGALVSRRLAAHHGARRLLLVSRSGAEAASAAELREELAELGADVTIAACDVASREDLQKTLDSIPEQHPLGAVIHTAGTIADGTIESIGPQELRHVLAPKADAAWHLHELTKDLDLSSFVLFSSVAGTIGSAGQANYAAANVFLDALARRRQAEGLPATAIGWGLWQRASGMTAELDESELARMGRAGVGALSDEQGLELFDAALHSGRPQALAVKLDRAGLRAQASAGTLPAIFSGLVRVPMRRKKTGVGALASKLATLPEDQREAFVLDLVRGEIASVLGHDSVESIGPEKAFNELGFDSLAAVELRNRLNAASGQRLPATVVFNHPSPKALAEYLLGEVTVGSAPKRVAVRAQVSEEPIAIVGMACRYPAGVASPAQLWNLVAEGRDGISEFPGDRGWDLERLYDPDPDRPDTSYSREGGFLVDPGKFDPEFFGIGPREALAMDPQQRLLLETSWEALEDAGIDPATLRGSSAGVFAGVSAQDYTGGMRGPEHELEGFRLTGSSTSVASGRVAYTLGLEGPAITVDTACSSSLVAMHLATQALRSGECPVALTGGATILASPGMFTEFARQRGLAPDGRSKSFAEAADGVTWSEGVGVLVLERLSDAQRNGHPVLALLKGTAVNQDGASNGLTAPNGTSQEHVIRQALANAGLEPQDVDAVEGHGTGTTLGDPIEAGALLATYGQDREEPLRLGSIKSNIGHGIAAAGVAGVIKMTMAMREGVLPRTLHVDQPSSNVDWEAGKVELLTEPREWQPDGKPRRAGVSSFGISGTNAHVIIEEAPEPAAVGDTEESQAPRAPLPGAIALPLSAKTEPALREAASNLATHLGDNPDLDPEDIAFSLARTRALFDQRAAITGSDREQLLAGLAALSDGEPATNVFEAKAAPGKLAYLLTGQGAQRAGMGKELHEASPVFAEALEEACEALDPHLEQPLKELLFAEGGTPEAALLDQTTFTQPALFATETALYRLTESLGMAPDYLLGHSIGEISAAHISGVLSLQDAAKLVCARAKLMGALPEGGAMVAIEATEQEVQEALEGKEDQLSIAAINGPTATVISGQEKQALEVQSHFEAQGKRTKRLTVSHAFHSPLIEPMLEDFAEVAKTLDYHEPKIPIVSNLTGEILTAEQAQDPSYWVSHARAAVRFAKGIETLDAQGVSTYLELGPDAVLTAMAASCLPEGSEAALIPTLREGRDEQGALAAAIASAHVAGAKLDWAKLYPSAKRVGLPTYPFQRKRYWLSQGSGPTDASSIGQREVEHPFLAAAIEDPDGERLTLTGRISLSTHPWLADHAVLGTVILPGTAFLELALRAGEEAGAETVEELTLQAPLVIPKQGAAQIQVTVAESDEQGSRPISIHSRLEAEVGGGEWTLHAAGALGAEVPMAPEPLAGWPPEAAEPVETEFAYDRLAERGFDYGPAFQGLRAAWRDGEEIYAEVALPEELREEAGRFAIHPALLDAALHGLTLDSAEGGGATQIPFAWSRVAIHAVGAGDLRVRFEVDGEARRLSVFDRNGAPVASIGSLSTRAVTGELGGGRKDLGGLFGLEWKEIPLTERDGGNLGDLATLGGLTLPGVERYESIAALAEAIRADAPVPGLVLCEPEPDAKRELAAASMAAGQGTLELLREWLAEAELATCRLALVTRGALCTSPEDSPELPAATLGGLLRSAQAEHPGRFALIDTDAGQGSREALLAAAGQEEEPQLALRGGVALVPRLAARPVQAGDEGVSIDPERTVLITGGTGGLGALVSRRLAAHHGARRLLLLSRSGAEAAGAAELREELAELGAEVTIAACDVSDRKQLKKLLASIPEQHPLGAVIHTAGAIDDGLIDSMDGEQLRRAFAPKAEGAWNLHELTKGLDLSAFVLFSSVAGLMGSPGQGNYAAANSFLDALAQMRSEEGLAGTSIAWGLWAGGGMASSLGEADLKRLERTGIAALSEEQGLALFDAAVGTGAPLSVALDISREGLRSLALAGVVPQILRGLVRVPRRRAGAASAALLERLSARPEEERETVVLELVKAEVAAVLGHDSTAAVDPVKAFKDLGFDSLAAVELRNRVAAASGLALQPTVVFDHPTASALARHLLGELAAGGSTLKAVARAQTSEEPIAIVGMSCRYPGGIVSPEGLWRLVADGVDGVDGFPTDRGWDLERLYDPDPESPGTSYSREGGFLHDAAEFDAEFFGVGPREAVAMDPQQRLLLEASWAALEDAGIDPAKLRGAQAGVFVGIMHHDYGNGGAFPAELEGYLGTGMASSIASGRVAYTLGLEGPAMTIDTACSSSLVTLHLAAQALRQGECSLALAGGATVLATPIVFTEFSRQRGLASDGRSKSFSEAADGVGWSEGVGMLTLQRLSDAQREGRRVLAVLQGSAVNQDGASNGLTAPNGPSQERVIRQALANARLEPKDVDVVEAHGTGTTLGDPIEAGALLATYGQDREEPLRLGSIKSNIGHTQAAAGVAGVIKMTMAMREGVLPRTLHVDQPSSKVDWEVGKVELLTEPREWQPNGKPRRAGVSSFGISGTNAHVIIEEAPEPTAVGDTEESQAPRAPLPGAIALPLSAKTEPALREAASNLATHLGDNPDLDPTDIAFSLARTRALFDQRAAITGSDREQLLAGLAALSDGEPATNVFEAKAAPGKLAYLLTGQGAQRAGMGKELHEASPVFAKALDEACEAIDQHIGRPLKELLFAKEGSKKAELLDDTTFTQPALFAIEVALFRTLEALGMKPDYLTGHSVGEIAAAHICGVLSLPDAARLITARASLMGELPKGGAMVAIEATEAEVTEALEGKEAELSIAAINGPTSIVISGQEEQALEVQSHFEAQGKRTKRLTVSHAFHSPLIEPMLEDFAEVAKTLDYHEPKIPIVSNLTGEILTAEQAQDPSYWVSHARAAVRFAKGIETLDAQGVSTYLELGPDAVLTAMAASCLPEGSEAALIPTLREGRDEQGALAAAIASAHVAGAKLDWAKLYPSAKRVGLPTYPFQRKRYWLNSSQGQADAGSIGQGVLDHPMLAAAIEDPDGERLTLTGRISLSTHPWLADHAVLGTVILPGTAFLELALRAGEEAGAETVEELTLQAPLVIPKQGAVALQVAVGAADDQGRRPISIHSRAEADRGGPGTGEWIQHAGGALGSRSPAATPPPAEWPPEGVEPLDTEFAYDRLAERGFDYGPAFQGLTAAWRDGEEIYAEVSLPEDQRAESQRFGLHPALLDSGFHAALDPAAAAPDQPAAPAVPFSWSGVALRAAGASSLRLALRQEGEGFSLLGMDETGATAIQVESLIARPIDHSQLQAAAGRRSLYSLQWPKRELEPAPDPLPAAAILGNREIEGLEAERHADLPALLEAIAGEGPVPETVVFDARSEAEPEDVPEASREVAQAALSLLQEWIAAEPLLDSRLIFLTEGAVAVEEGESPDLRAAPLWGLLRSAHSEHPGRFALIDTEGSNASSEALATAIAAAGRSPSWPCARGRP